MVVKYQFDPCFEKGKKKKKSEWYNIKTIYLFPFYFFIIIILKKKISSTRENKSCSIPFIKKIKNKKNF